MLINMPSLSVGTCDYIGEQHGYRNHIVGQTRIVQISKLLNAVSSSQQQLGGWMAVLMLPGERQAASSSCTAHSLPLDGLRW
jgi:hypothetical protein